MAENYDDFSTPALSLPKSDSLEAFGLGSAPRMPRADGPRPNRGGQTLDVNNFDAIRITLASPEAIRGWSYGEVTKPETINYRTLKPEHGGLFCERIFGPTKDWECYCGKYKRIRHAGTVCDKCGVEVTRAKVRRERMAHIELAAPVAHIWYVKGTPSRLGLLLDISPRNLERVLYFASYLVTDVNEDQRTKAIEDINAIAEEEIAEIKTEMEGRANNLSEGAGAMIANLSEGASSTKDVAEAARKKSAAALKREYNKIKKELEANLNEAAKKAITFQGTVLVEADEAINADRLQLLDEANAAALDRINEKYEADASGVSVLAGAEADYVGYETDKQLRDIENELMERIREVETERDEALKAINEIDELQILSETQYRELQDLVPPGVFKAGMGAEAVHDFVSKKIDLDQIAIDLRNEMQDKSEVKRKKAAKRLRVVDALRKSGNKPEWMIFSALPVIPPELRPMVQLDGGRFATSDLNDLYRRVINRNNRLKRLLELGAPDIIVRNEKRMLQEAVDALIDNGRRGRVVSGSGKHKLKSLSDMLKGKQGRFRQNLLGKRVDYSGRSVIVVGPTLKLDECGLPKRMALELFKPFVMRRLVERNLAHNIKAAKRLVERQDPQVWEMLEEVTRDYLVLLNRAPTLHRLGIQAFKVKLIEGSAIQLHPMVCPAFNADFDGDQMAVHVPLSRKAQDEARNRMLSVRNLLSPSNGDPIVSPTQDIIVGGYHLTCRRSFMKNFGDQSVTRGWGKEFGSLEEVRLAYDAGAVDLKAEIRVYTDRAVVDGSSDKTDNSQRFDVDGFIERDGVKFWKVDTTVGRVVFNLALPMELGTFYNCTLNRNELRKIVADCYRFFKDPEKTATVINDIKDICFKFSTIGTRSISIRDCAGDPASRQEIVAEAKQDQETLNRNHRRGLLTDQERLDELEKIWNEARRKLTQALESEMSGQRNTAGLGVVDKKLTDNHSDITSMSGLVEVTNPLYTMASSGAKGNMNNLVQVAGMRGLVLNTQNQVINFPITRNYKEGLTSLDYFLASHGARKGNIDTAMRTADSGYLTRRLVDVSQDVIVTLEDCGTEKGMSVDIPNSEDARFKDRRRPDFQVFDDAWDLFQRRVKGRYLAAEIVSEDGVIIARRGDMIVDDAEEMGEGKVTFSDALRSCSGSLLVRTVMQCEAAIGVCQMCYGKSLATGELVEMGDAVGVIAAQSIGEPGTQLTMRTFHTGGGAGLSNLIGQQTEKSDAAMRARVAHRRKLIKIVDNLVGTLDRREEAASQIGQLDVLNLVPIGDHLAALHGATHGLSETDRFGQLLHAYRDFDRAAREIEPVAGYERIRKDFATATATFAADASPRLDAMKGEFSILALMREYRRIEEDLDRLREKLADERAEVAAAAEVHQQKTRTGRKTAQEKPSGDRALIDRKIELYKSMQPTEIRRARDKHVAEVASIEEQIAGLEGKLSQTADLPLVAAALRTNRALNDVADLGRHIEFANFDRTRKWLDGLDLADLTGALSSALPDTANDEPDEDDARSTAAIEQILAELGEYQSALGDYRTTLKDLSKEIGGIRHLEPIQQWEQVLDARRRTEAELELFQSNLNDFSRESQAYEDTQESIEDRRGGYLEAREKHQSFVENSEAALASTAGPLSDSEGPKTKSTAKTIQVRKEQSGLPRVEEIFEARNPGRPAIIADREGVVTVDDTALGRLLAITSSEIDQRVYRLDAGWQVEVTTGGYAVKDKTVLATGPNEEKLVSELDGEVAIDGRTIYVRNEKSDRIEHLVPLVYEIFVNDGDQVFPGQQLTDGTKNPDQILLTQGLDAVQRYIIDEVQKVYRSQGVNTNDKHIEVICRQMLRKVSITNPGDTDYLQDERIDRFEFNQINEEILAQGGEPATGIPVLLGITKASLETDSFLSAASFQETTRVLTEAAINGKVDRLRGLKENVIIGKLIPAGSGFGVQPTIQLPIHEQIALAAVLEKPEPAESEDYKELMETGFLPDGLPDVTADEESDGEIDGIAALIGAVLEEEKPAKPKRASRAKAKKEPEIVEIDDFADGEE